MLARPGRAAYLVVLHPRVDDEVLAGHVQDEGPGVGVGVRAPGPAALEADPGRLGVVEGGPG
eukprot:15274729-Alexandrium_andersonii.AAC.1